MSYITYFYDLVSDTITNQCNSWLQWFGFRRKELLIEDFVELSILPYKAKQGSPGLK